VQRDGNSGSPQDKPIFWEYKKEEPGSIINRALSRRNKLKCFPYS
jgi:hypothetical protein